MSDEGRLDGLTDQALREGWIPDGAAPGERGGIARALEARRVLERAAAEMDEDLRRATPFARARFQRFVAAQDDRHRAPSPPPVRSRRWPSRIALLGPSRLALAAVPLVLAILVVGGFFLAGRGFGGADTALAQVLQPGDYVQLDGVVVAADEGGEGATVTLQGELGSFSVGVSGETALVGPGGTAGGELAIGSAVLVGGTVNPDGTIAAGTVAVSGQAAALPGAGGLRELRRLRGDLAGSVVLIAVAEDGLTGTVCLRTGEGELYVVRVDGDSARAVLRSVSSALGAQVEVLRRDTERGPFQLRLGEARPRPASPSSTGEARREAAAQSGAAAADRPSFLEVRGVLIGRRGTVLSLRTEDGLREVVVTRSTRFLLRRSDLTLEGWLRGENAIGSMLIVAGGTDPESGRFVAGLITVGPNVSQDSESR